MNKILVASERLRFRLELLGGMTRREVLGRYRGSIFGVAWSLVAPLLMLCVYTVAFHELLGARWPGVPGRAGFAVMVFTGMVLHAMLAEVLVRAPTAISAQPNFVKKLVFPLTVLPLVVVGAAVFHAALGLVVVAASPVFGGPGIQWTALLVPAVLLPFVVLLAGLAWGLAAIGVYVRDVAQLGGLFATILLFLSPIFFPLESIPGTWRAVALANPLTFVVEASRGMIFDGHLPDPGALAAYSVIALAVAMGGLALFRHLRPGFGDVL